MLYETWLIWYGTWLIQIWCDIHTWHRWFIWDMTHFIWDMTDLIWDMTHSCMMWHSQLAWLITMRHVSFICHMSHSYVPWLVDMQHDSASFLAGIEKPSTWNTGPGQILKAWFDPSSIQKKYQTNVMISSHRHAKMSFWLSFWQMDQKSKICQKDKLRDDVTKLSHLNKFQKNGMFWEELPCHTQNQVWALGIFQNDPHFRNNPHSYVKCTHIHMMQSVMWHIHATTCLFLFFWFLFFPEGTMQNTNSRPYASCDIAFSFLLISFFPRRHNAKHKLKAICIVWHCVFFSFDFFFSPKVQCKTQTQGHMHRVTLRFLLISFFPRRYNAKHKLKAICIDPGEVNTDITRDFPCASIINAFLKIVLPYF